MRSREPAKLKVILDTSVLVAALLSKNGGSARIVNLALTGRIHAFHTDETFTELRAVLQRPKFGLGKETQEHYIHLLAEASFLVKPLAEFTTVRCRDPKDDKFLALAEQVEADYLISLDADLLDLKTAGDTRIVEPGVFLEVLKRR